MIQVYQFDNFFYVICFLSISILVYFIMLEYFQLNIKFKNIINFFKFHDPELVKKKLVAIKKILAESGMSMDPSLEKEIKKKIKEYEKELQRSLTPEEIIIISIAVGILLTILFIYYFYSL
jgi:hypothetical protein